MKLSNANISNQNFKSHYYCVNRMGELIIKVTNLNANNAQIVYKHGKHLLQSEMIKEGNSFLYPIFTFQNVIKYFIKNKDKNKFDHKKKKCIIPLNLLRKNAQQTIRKLYRYPMVQSYKNGTSIGKLYLKKNISNNDIKNITKPTIVATETLDFININNPNIIGVILINNDIKALSHFGTRLRNNMQILCSIYKPSLIKNIKEYQGQNIRIKVQDSTVKIEHTKERGIPQNFPKISVPRLKFINKILLSNEYSLDIVGAKAYNLRRLEELVEKNKIDVIIPKSITLPYGYLQTLIKGNPNINIKKDYKIEYDIGCRKLLNNLIEFLNKNGISNDKIIIRSAFNGEDLSNYSAAGLYDSYVVSNKPKEIFEAIIRVIKSKWNQEAILSREKYQIKEEDIKPSVIIQNKISPDYKFTLYTHFNKDQIRIELNDLIGREKFLESNYPDIFIYDKKSKKLIYESISIDNVEIWYNQNFQLMPHLIKNDLSKNKKLLKILKKIVKNALEIEKEFQAPQDIEGGIKGSDIYLWQTRNIIG